MVQRDNRCAAFGGRMVLIPFDDVSKFLLTDAIADVVVLATAHPRSGAHCKIQKECPGHDAAPGVGTFFPSFAVEPGAQAADVDAANIGQRCLPCYSSRALEASRLCC